MVWLFGQVVCSRKTVPQSFLYNSCENVASKRINASSEVTYSMDENHTRKKIIIRLKISQVIYLSNLIYPVQICVAKLINLEM